MTWLRKPAGPLLGLGAVFVGEILILLGLRAAGVRLDEMGQLGLMLLIAVPALWLMLVYWRRIDELARDAQKTAWFWGGSFGMGVGLMAVVLMQHPGLQLVRFVPPRFEGTELITFGALVVVGAQLIGFLAAWGFWWWSKR